MEKLKVGDVVVLKSGGPNMTIQRIEENGDIFCVWFIIYGINMEGPYEYSFKIDQLKLVKA